MFREREGDDTWTPSKAPLPLPARGETVMVVTGLPRSGTSMMMQMLAAGGVPAFTDDHRPADASNERGYLEHELVMKMPACFALPGLNHGARGARRGVAILHARGADCSAAAS